VVRVKVLLQSVVSYREAAEAVPADTAVALLVLRVVKRTHILYQQHLSWVALEQRLLYQVEPLARLQPMVERSVVPHQTYQLVARVVLVEQQPTQMLVPSIQLAVPAVLDLVVVDSVVQAEQELLETSLAMVQVQVLAGTVVFLHPILDVHKARLGKSCSRTHKEKLYGT
jgi:hypothetical protein